MDSSGRIESELSTAGSSNETVRGPTWLLIDEQGRASEMFSGATMTYDDLDSTVQRLLGP